MEALEARLRGRNTEDESSILRRLANAKAELDYGLAEGNFDKVFVNDDLEKTCEDMAKQFVEWYPDLLGKKLPLEPPSDNGTGSGSSEGVTPETNLPPPIVDPLSLPKTEDGLKALLAEIDQDCPLEGYSQAQLTYQASGIYVKAGKKLDIALPPVEQDGSKVEWTVTLVDEHSEQLDLEFGLAVIVDGEEVMVREMGRILSPSISKTEEEETDEERTNTNEGDTSNGEDDQEGGATPSAKGKFTVANSAPVTVVIKLDNSYSWFTPKKINYSFTIIPPVDDNMIQRSIRAKSVLPRILEAKAAAVKARDNEKARSDALERIRLEMMEKLDQLNKQLECGKQSIQEIHKSAEEAEQKANQKANEIKETLSAVKKEEQSIESCSKQIVALEEECARLKKQWEELKLERQVRQEEKVQLETQAEACRQQRIQLQADIVAKREEEKSKSAELASLEMDLSLMRDNLNDLEKEKNARRAEEKSFVEEVSFFQKQLDAIKLRFIEPKS
ncbi:hypothetical protein HJC23_004749 [Cyclotella cryptica]|uniref:GOLD domain-containing protein n=1 Tax=Cyclotella cryptica TaxID=29204 RepID=A0ABD3PE58_9STRA